MTDSVTNIIIAAAAVIGLVPLGVGTIVNLIKGRRKKKSSEQLSTVALSVILSLIAPDVLNSTFRHVAAIRDALPDWVTAAIPEQPAEAKPATEAQPSVNGSAPPAKEAGAVSG
jgi:uncharacterized membrane protein